MAVVHLAQATGTQLLTGGALSGLLTGSGSNYASLVVYSGAMPASADTALSGNSALATFQFNQATPLGTPSHSSPNTISAVSLVATSVTASATGTATFARLLTSSGATVMDLDVTATGGGGSLTIASTSIVSGVAVTATSLSLGFPTN